jgi:hypothetical protein
MKPWTCFPYIHDAANMTADLLEKGHPVVARAGVILNSVEHLMEPLVLYSLSEHPFSPPRVKVCMLPVDDASDFTL